MKASVYQKAALLFGLIAGMVFIIFNFTSWKLGVRTYANTLAIEKFIPYIFLLFLLGGIRLRKNNNDTIRFADALKFAFLAYIVFSLIEAIANYFLYNIIDKGLTSSLFEVTKEQSVQFMKRLGSTKEQIDETLKNAEATKNETGFRTIFLGLGLSIIWSFGKSIVLAMIIKKEKTNN
ncbi:MAG: DUF4199 domain-containing protein [Sphingobacteriia bacterium]|nr:DUF4199 domain-containing protein [Sphingobacteriia bacterium]